MKGHAVVTFSSPTPQLVGEVELTTYGWVHIRNPARRTGAKGKERDTPLEQVAVSVPARHVFRIEWIELKVYL